MVSSFLLLAIRKALPWTCRHGILLAAASAYLALVPNLASAQSTPEGGATEAAESANNETANKKAAKMHYAHAIAAYRRRDYEEALAELQLASALFDSHIFLYNIAQAERMLGRCAAAREDYVRYLDRETDKSRRALAEEGLDRLSDCLPSALAATSERPLSFPPPGVETERRDDPQPLPPLQPLQDTAPTQPWAWTTGAAGVAMLTAAIVVGLVGSRRYDQAVTLCGGRTRYCPPAALDKRGTAETLANVGNALAIAAAIGVGVSVTLFFIEGDRPGESGAAATVNVGLARLSENEWPMNR